MGNSKVEWELVHLKYKQFMYKKYLNQIQSSSKDMH